jgi:hypothetical protein
MIGKLADELLADHSGRAENAYVDSFGLHDLLLSLPLLAPRSAAAERLARAQKKTRRPVWGRRVLVILL